MDLTEIQMNFLREYANTGDAKYAVKLGKDLMTSQDALLRILGQTWIEVGERELKDQA